MPVAQTFEVIYHTVLTSSVYNLTISSISQSYDHLCITSGWTRNLSGNFGGRAAEFQWNGITSGYKGINWLANPNGLSASRTTNGAAEPAISSGNILIQGREASEIWIPNYTNTTWFKHALYRQYVNDAADNSGGFVRINDGLISTTAALTSLYIYQQVDPFISGDWITIYGVKDA